MDDLIYQMTTAIHDQKEIINMLEDQNTSLIIEIQRLRSLIWSNNHSQN